MKTAVHVLLGCAWVALWAGCGDPQVSPDGSDGPGVPDVARPDGPAPVDVRPDRAGDATDPTDLPPDAGPPVGLGEACAPSIPCGKGQTCREEGTGFPGGLCTTACDPDDAASCPAGTVCGRPTGTADPACLLLCDKDVADGCREGYLCSGTTPAMEVAGKATACLPVPFASRIGDPCVTDLECPVATFCVSEQRTGLPGGYCLAGCTPGAAGACGALDQCVTDANPQNAQGGICARSCDPTETSACRPGYACVSVFAGEATASPVCAPGSETAQLGDPCERDSDCAAGRGLCVRETPPGFQSILGPPGGYCSEPCDPATADSCGAEAECVADATPTNFRGGLCIGTCDAAGADCRPGYACAAKALGQTTTSTVCVPGDPSAQIGDPCDSSGDCAPGGACIFVGGQIPGGYCTATCEAGVAGSCGAGAECVGPAGNATCVKSCQAGADCREGYACVSGFQGTPSAGTVCAPGTLTPVPTGRDCADSSDCMAGSGFCFNESDFPGGYCSGNCDPRVADSCGAGAFCNPSGPDSGLCLAVCQQDADCAALRTAGSAGTYGCSAVLAGSPLPGGVSACLPFTADAEIGDPCAGLGLCALGGACVGPPANPDFFEGYCTAACSAADPDSCGPEGVCLVQAAGRGSCARACETQSQCREGYNCLPINAAGDRACLP